MGLIGDYGWIAAVAGIILVLKTIWFIRPTERGLVERFGKYNRFAKSGMNVVIPVLESMRKINITEQIVNAERQEVITGDNLNATVDAQVYYKLKEDEESLMKSQYNVADVNYQIVQLARTTLRNQIGAMTLRDTNSKRDEINKMLYNALTTETKNWGVEIIRTELKEIEPPKEVQTAMNQVVIAENQKIAAMDQATAIETQADGKRRAAIKEAEGIKQARILEAEGEAQAIRSVSEAAQKYFKGNAQVLKKLETVQNVLSNNAKFVLPSDAELVNVIGDMAGVLPLRKQKGGA